MLKKLQLRPGVVLDCDTRYFPLTQDSVLLADFAAPVLRGRGLDLGAGQGYLSALTLLRAPQLHLEGLELVPEAAAVASRNLAAAGFAVPMTVGDLRELPAFMNGRYDFCLCNPPYFQAAQGPLSPREPLKQARSDSGASLPEICFAANRLLKTGGRLFLCLPPARMAPLFSALEQMHFAPKRLRAVQETAADAAQLILLEARKQGGEGLTLLPPLILRDARGSYTPEYRRIYEGS